jgi:hypothetical protein
VRKPPLRNASTPSSACARTAAPRKPRSGATDPADQRYHALITPQVPTSLLSKLPHGSLTIGLRTLQSLCNACGIRFKKAGRRSAANGSSESPPTSPRGSKREVADEDEHYWVFPPDARPRKRSRGALLSGSCMTWQALPLESRGEKNSYSSDEEEGAVLLMALSCGVVNA